jgi:hypothetical protein
MYAWETALTTRDTNRIVRPLEWGEDWLAEFVAEAGLSGGGGGLRAGGMNPEELGRAFSYQ